MNFLEELVAEWYEYQGFFVCRNIKFGAAAGKSTGGHSGEIDVLAYRPKNSALVHIEASSDFNSWEKRRIKFVGKKFTKLATKEYAKIIGFVPSSVKRIAVVSHTRKPANLVWRTRDGLPIEVIDIPDFIATILSEFRKKRHAREVSVPEQLPLLRAIHYTISYGDDPKIK